MTHSITDRLKNRLVKNFFDILILSELKKTTLSGYDIIGLINEKYDIVMSCGTIYSQLYSLERKGIIKGIQTTKKRIYNITEKGQKDIESISQVRDKIEDLIQTL